MKTTTRRTFFKKVSAAGLAIAPLSVLASTTVRDQAVNRTSATTAADLDKNTLVNVLDLQMVSLFVSGGACPADLLP